MEKYHLLITKLVTLLCVTDGAGDGGGGQIARKKPSSLLNYYNRMI